MNLDELKAICDAPTPIKFSKCPECGTSKPPTWTERYAGGDSQCSECEKVSYNWRWIAYTDGVSDEQFLKVARIEMPKLIDRIQKLEAALARARPSVERAIEAVRDHFENMGVPEGIHVSYEHEDVLKDINALLKGEKE